MPTVLDSDDEPLLSGVQAAGQNGRPSRRVRRHLAQRGPVHVQLQAETIWIPHSWTVVNGIWVVP